MTHYYRHSCLSKYELNRCTDESVTDPQNAVSNCLLLADVRLCSTAPGWRRRTSSRIGRRIYRQIPSDHCQRWKFYSLRDRAVPVCCFLSRAAYVSVQPVAYRGGGSGGSNRPPKFRRYRWSPRSHEQEEPASRFPFVFHCVLIRL